MLLFTNMTLEMTYVKSKNKINISKTGRNKRDEVGTGKFRVGAREVVVSERVTGEWVLEGSSQAEDGRQLW